MTQNTIIKKGLIVGIILLFLTIGFSPIINAQDNTILPKLSPIPQTIGNVPITVFEYRPDGTIEKTVVRMTREQADNFNKEMTGAKDLDTRLSIYKNYNLIPQNVTADTLQAGMQEKAQKIGLTQAKLEHMIRNNHSLFNKQVYQNLFCIMSCTVQGGWEFLLIPFGTSLITYYFFPGPFGHANIPCFDVLDYIIGSVDNFKSTGTLGSIQGNFQGIMKIVGFVGFMYQGYAHNSMFIQGFDGFAVYMRAKGTLS